MDAATDGWQAAAVSFWVERALRRANKPQPLLEWQLIGEVKKWGPEKLPAGVSVKAYVKAVVQGLKADPRLQYRPSASGASPMFLAAAAPAPPEVRAAVEYWVEQIRTRAALGSRLTVAQLLDAVHERAPAGGYALAGALVAAQTFFTQVHTRLLSDPRVSCVSEQSADGKPVKLYVPRCAAGSPALVFRSGGAAADGAAAPPPSDGTSPLRALRSATDEAAQLHAASLAATYADVTGALPDDADDAADDICDDGAQLPGGVEGVRAYFAERRRGGGAGVLARGYAAADGERCGAFAEAALLGHLRGGDDAAPREVHLNTHEPFCLVAVGVQGGGKSHSLACVLESCLLPFPTAGVVRLDAPMTALVLHYDSSPHAVCEATGLLAPAPALRRMLGGAAPALPRERLVVLVSPSYYKQRAAFYGNHCTVKPLLLRWHTLSADHLKRIMRVKEGDSQLYVASLLDLLRRYQRAGKVPKFAQFCAEVTALCSVKGQSAPLEQRLALLESLVAESALNAELRPLGGDVTSACTPGALVVVDLTDPMLSAEEANGVFTVLVEAFRAAPAATTGAGKLLVLDEAHKYMTGAGGDGLSAAIVTCARLMRHDGLRLAVSTQSPAALAPELLELVSVALLHRFHSADWLAHLAKKLPLAGDAVWRRLIALEPGEALMFVARHMLPADAAVDADGHVFELAVRPRLTADRGASRTNAAPATPQQRRQPPPPYTPPTSLGVANAPPTLTNEEIESILPAFWR